MQRDTFARLTGLCAMIVGLMLCCIARGVSPEIDPDRRKPHQSTSRGEPPQSPETFDPDPNPLVLPVQESPDLFELSRSVGTGAPSFNPDPGATVAEPAPRPFFDEKLGKLPAYGEEVLPGRLALPRAVTRRVELVPAEPSPVLCEWFEALPATLQLPRQSVRANDPISYDYKFHVPHYELSEHGKELPADTEPRTDRWRIGYEK